MSDRILHKRMSRRSTGIGALFAASALMARATIPGLARRQTAPPPVITGDCTPEPGVQLLIDWRFGLPVMTLSEVLPPLNWVRYIHPTSPLTFLYPPDWTPQALWAETLSSNGTPNWIDQPPAVTQLTSGRILSPKGDAAFEFVGGMILGTALTPGQSAMVAEQGMLGENPTLTPICTYEDSNPLVQGWFHGDRTGKSILVTYGWPLANSTGLYPTTIITYYSLFGPQSSYETLMRTVFIPILYQLTASGGGPTPTPEP